MMKKACPCLHFFLVFFRFFFAVLASLGVLTHSQVQINLPRSTMNLIRSGSAAHISKHRSQLVDRLSICLQAHWEERRTPSIPGSTDHHVCVCVCVCLCIHVFVRASVFFFLLVCIYSICVCVCVVFCVSSKSILQAGNDTYSDSHGDINTSHQP